MGLERGRGGREKERENKGVGLESIWFSLAEIGILGLRHKNLVIGKGRSMEDCSRSSRGFFWLPITQWPKLNNTPTLSLSLFRPFSFHSMPCYKSKLLQPNYCITSPTPILRRTLFTFLPLTSYTIFHLLSFSPYPEPLHQYRCCCSVFRGTSWDPVHVAPPTPKPPPSPCLSQSQTINNLTKIPTFTIIPSPPRLLLPLPLLTAPSPSVPHPPVSPKTRKNLLATTNVPPFPTSVGTYYNPNTALNPKPNPPEPPIPPQTPTLSSLAAAPIVTPPQLPFGEMAPEAPR